MQISHSLMIPHHTLSSKFISNLLSQWIWRFCFEHYYSWSKCQWSIELSKENEILSLLPKKRLTKIPPLCLIVHPTLNNYWLVRFFLEYYAIWALSLFLISGSLCFFQFLLALKPPKLNKLFIIFLNSWLLGKYCSENVFAY